MDHPSYHRPGNPYGDIFGAFGDNQVLSIISSCPCGVKLDQAKRSTLPINNDIFFFSLFFPPFGLSSFGLLYFVTQRAKLP